MGERGNRRASYRRLLHTRQRMRLPDQGS